MLACREVVQLWSSDAIERAPLMRRLAVRMHLMFCRHCQRYVREIGTIQSAAKAASRDDTPALEYTQRILDAMRHAREY